MEPTENPYSLSDPTEPPRPEVLQHPLRLAYYSARSEYIPIDRSKDPPLRYISRSSGQEAVHVSLVSVSLVKNKCYLAVDGPDGKLYTPIISLDEFQQMNPTVELVFTNKEHDPTSSGQMRADECLNQMISGGWNWVCKGVRKILRRK